MRRNRIKTVAIIVAGGVGSRMNSDIPKQFVEVLGKPIIAYTINSFSKCNDIDEIIIVTHKDYLVFTKDIVDAFGFKKVTKIVCGADSRQSSVYKGLQELDDDAQIVAIHDGARPMISTSVISNCISAAQEYGCAAVGVKMKDTIKAVDDEGFIKGTVDREKLWQIQTPQVFKKDIILDLHSSNVNCALATDDCILAELAGYKVKIVDGDYENIKITTPQDIYIMEGLLGG